MSNDDIAVTLTIPVEKLPEPSVPSTQMECNRCHRPVWVGRYLIDTILADGFRKIEAMCLPCVTDDELRDFLDESQYTPEGFDANLRELRTLRNQLREE